MSDKSPHKSASKKTAGKTLKEKRSAKKAKRDVQSSHIPPTGN